MNYFDDYYSSQQPQEEPEYIPQEQPKAPKVRKERKGLKRLLSVVLVLALVFGSCGATALILNNYWQNEMNAMMQRMDDKLATLQKGTVTGEGKGVALFFGLGFRRFCGRGGFSGSRCFRRRHSGFDDLSGNGFC